MDSLADISSAQFSPNSWTIVPTEFRKDVSQIESLLENLRERHDEVELANLIVVAASRNIAERKRTRSGLAAALVRGLKAREDLKEAEGGSISAEEARKFLGEMSKQGILDRYKKGRLLGWRANRQNAVRFPVWQFTEKGLLPGLEAVLGILRASSVIDNWAIIQFFVNKRGSLKNERPLDVLRRGDIEGVKRAAQGFIA